MLTQKINPKSGKTEYCLVSVKDPSKILRWFGTQKPSGERVASEEARVNYFKHKKKTLITS